MCKVFGSWVLVQIGARLTDCENNKLIFDDIYYSKAV